MQFIINEDDMLLTSEWAQIRHIYAKVWLYSNVQTITK